MDDFVVNLRHNISAPPPVTAAVYIPCPFNSACSSPFMDLVWLLLKRANPNSCREKKYGKEMTLFTFFYGEFA
jgi:hypothetical protein